MVDELFGEFERRGLKAEIANGALRLLPVGRIDDDLREAIKARMPDILARLASNGDREIEWRLKEFLFQLHPIELPAVLPFLVTLEDAPLSGPGDCASCGDSMQGGEGFICPLCATAKRLALDLWMARPAKVKSAA